jgi:D-lactate dehydrogenase
MFGPAESTTGVREAFLALCDRADVPVRVPEAIASLCCGTPWKSKGLSTGYDAMRAQVVPALVEASEGGTLPIVVDAASCTEGLQRLLAEEPRFTVVDAVDFVDSTVLSRLPTGRRIPSLVLHPTCSSTQLGINPALLRVAAAAAEHVVVPEDWGCCAFAGDRGMLHPELTASATADEARAVDAAGPFTAYASVNRTCELGMTRATGHPYRHVLETLEEVTRAASRVEGP